MTLARVQQVVKLSFSGFGDPICIRVKERRNGIIPFPTPLQQPCGVVPTVRTTPHLLQALPSSALQRILGILLRGDLQQLLRKL